METLQRLHNRGSISTGEYEIDNSLKLEADNTEKLYFTPGSSGNRKTWTYSCWFKITEADKYCMLMGTADTYMYIDQYGGDMHIRLDKSGAAGGNYLYTTPRYRDTSAWYHFVLAVDTTQATAANRAKFYVNGVQVTDFATEVYPAQNADTDWNFTNVHYVGGWSGAAYDSSGYLAEVHSVDGQQLEPTDFGEFDTDTGLWKPKEYTGTYGTNGFYLDFENSADLGDDTSGNNKNFVLSNITSADQATDTPTNNFCIINAINLSTQTLTEGATKIVSTDNSSRTSFGTMAVSKGKWWWEGKIQVYDSNTTYPCIGVTGDLDNPPATSAQLWGSNHVVKLAKAQKWVSNDTGYSYGTAYADNDIINIALDMDNHIMYTYKNGTIDDANGIDFSSQSAATAGNFYIPINLVYVSGGGSSWEMNFGGFANYTISSAASDANGYGNFEYAPPSGYYALCSKNLAEYG